MSGSVPPTRSLQPESRAARRYRASLPIEVFADGETGIRCTYSISVTGCIVCGGRPSWVLGTTCAATILLGAGDSIDVPVVNTEVRPNGDFLLRWTLDARDSRKLVHHLEVVDVEPSAESKASFLQAENSLIHAEIMHVENQRRLGYQFVYLLVAAYFAYTVAPFKLFAGLYPIEALGIYAIAGTWISVLVLFHCDRFFEFIAVSVRRRAHLYKALAGNRGWLFAHDPHFYAKTVMPVASTYDDLRAQRLPFSDDREENPQWMRYNRSTINFMFVLQSFFVIGTMYYLSLILRLYSARFEAGLRYLDPLKQQQLFRYDWFLWACGVFAIVPLAWVHMFGNRSAALLRRIWESQRITAQRPNPRFASRMIRHGYPVWFFSLRVLSGILLVWGGSGLLRLLPAYGSSTGLWTRLTPSWPVVATCAILFLVGKLAYAYVSLRIADATDHNSKSLREIGRATPR